MNKIYLLLISIIIVLVGLLLFILFPPKINAPNIVDNKMTILDKQEFEDELGKYQLDLDLLVSNTESFFVLSAFEIVNYELVYFEVKHQIDFQYLETPNEHYEIFIYYDSSLERYYYFTQARGEHEGNIYGYVDQGSNDFHIGHKSN